MTKLTKKMTNTDNLTTYPVNLKILQWNAGALSQTKKVELARTLNKQKIDVFTIMEANLSNEDVKYYHFNGYTLHILQKYRQIASGILVGVRNDITNTFTEVKHMGTDTDKSEIVQVDVWKNEFHYKIYAVYSPPNNKPDFSILNFTNKTIFLGDFNGHSPIWGYTDTNASGKETEDILNTSNLQLVYNKNDTHTYLHYNETQTTPDLLLVSSDIFLNTEREIVDDPGSGHRPVIATITLSPQRGQPRTKNVRSSWNFRKADWGKFTSCLENTLIASKIDFTQHPSIIGNYISEQIIAAAKHSIPRGTIGNFKCFWNSDLETLKQEREAQRKIAEDTKTQENVMKWRQAAAKLKRAISEAKRQAFHTFISNANFQDNSTSIHRFLNKIQNKTSFVNKQPFNHCNKPLTTDRAIANEYVKLYSNNLKKSPYSRQKSKDIKQ